MLFISFVQFVSRGVLLAFATAHEAFVTPTIRHVNLQSSVQIGEFLYTCIPHRVNFAEQNIPNSFWCRNYLRILFNFILTRSANGKKTMAYCVGQFDNVYVMATPPNLCEMTLFR